MKLAEFLLNCSDEFNGHKQTDLGEVSMKDAVNLLGELADACEDIADIFSLELYRDGSFSIIQKGYWNRGEHPIGHTDRLICSGMINLKREEDTMSHNVPLHTADSVRTLVEALEHIREYWNRDHNEQAMADALWHIIETADEALSGKVVNDDECALVAQVEPIGFCEDTALSLAERTFSSDVDEQLAEDVIQYARRLHDLYTAPQTAEQQSSPDVAVLVEHERRLFEARMRRVAPGVNLEMIGDRYNDLDTQWKFELWLDRAALAGKGVK